MIRRCTALVFVVLTLAACADAAQRESIGAPAVELVEELRLDPNVEDFSVVGRVAVGPGGRIAVQLRQDRHIRMYDSTGARLPTVGRRGSGPGEFQNLGPLGWVADTLWVFDNNHRRVSYFAANGELVRDVSLPAPVAIEAFGGPDTRFTWFSPSAVAADGSMYGEAQLRTAGSTDGDSERVYLHVSAYSSEEQTSDSTGAEGLPPGVRIVARPPARDDERWFMSVEQFRRSIPFAAVPIVSYGHDGRFAYVTTELGDDGSGMFTLTMFDGAGDTTLTRSYPVRGLPIPEHVRDSTLAAFIPPEGRRREGPADLPQRFQAMARERMPAYYPPIREVLLGLDGSVWLTMRDTADTRRALILNRDGDPVGTFPLRPRTSIRAATSSHVWMAERDEVDLTAVVRHRVSARR